MVKTTSCLKGRAKRLCGISISEYLKVCNFAGINKYIYTTNHLYYFIHRDTHKRPPLLIMACYNFLPRSKILGNLVHSIKLHLTEGDSLQALIERVVRWQSDYKLVLQKLHANELSENTSRSLDQQVYKGLYPCLLFLVKDLLQYKIKDGSCSHLSYHIMSYI